MTSLGWVDFSSEHRSRVQTVIDLLHEKGVVDELGIGIIRNSFADRMFPGISTIQTRAKYFTLTACLIKDYELNHSRRDSGKSLEEYLERQEKRCRIQLVERYGDSWQNLGIIGGSFGLDRYRDVVRKPSSIYWNGLRTFGMISPNVSLAEFSNLLSKPSYMLRTLVEETGRDRGDDLDADDRSLIRVVAPEVDGSFWDQMDIVLTDEEARFLRQQITATQADSLIGQILLDEKALNQVLKLSRNARFETFAELPFIQNLNNPELVRTVEHARDFWRILYGAHIRYNCLLQEHFGEQELYDKFEKLWEEWCEDISDFPSHWDTSFLWERVASHGSRLPSYTRNFVEMWIEETRNGARNTDQCNELVRIQEQNNKRGRARLRPKNQGEQVGEWLGLSTLEYRLPQVLQIVRDIYDGEGEAADA